MDLPPELPPEEDAPPPPTVACWRCGKQAPADQAKCPFCAAALPVSAPASGPTFIVSAPMVGRPAKSGAVDEAKPLLQMVGVFTVLLLTSLVAGLIQGLQGGLETDGALPTAEELITPVVVLDVIFTVLVLFSLVWIALPRERTTVSWGRWLAAWVGFWPVLAVLLAINLGYHVLLRDTLGVESIEKMFFLHPEALAVWVLLICVQPAIIEELFFRHVALRTLRSVMGVHGAVWISSLMFALAHIGAPLSMPMLMVMGVGLGYARVASGGLMLPMAMHFAHNAAVLAVEWHHWNPA